MARPVLFILITLILSCNVQPQPINFGVDNCEFCKMTIIDNKFATEIVTKKGKAFKFDSIECMVRFIKKDHTDTALFAQILVSDFAAQGNLINAYQAFYLHSQKLESPMGEGLSAYDKKEDLNSAQKNFSGDDWNWQQVIENIK